MCGRFSRYVGPDSLEIRYNSRMNVPYSKSYNVAPSQELPILSQNSPGEFKKAFWGYPASFTEGKPIINARAETLLEKSIFALAINANRCLIPATGFYEWKTLHTEKIPFHIKSSRMEIISFAGIVVKDEILKKDYAIIITTTPSEQMAEIHERMPVILNQRAEREWLNQEAPIRNLIQLLIPYADHLDIQEVSTRINSPQNDDPQVLIKETSKKKMMDDFFSTS